MTGLEKAIRAKIRDVRNFPKKGIVFKDITPLLQDAASLDRVCAALEKIAQRRGTDLVAGIESRGFIFGSILAARLGAGFVTIRKRGKLPGKTWRQSFALEYGRETIEIHRDAVEKGDRVLVVDDVLATGGTMAAACKLVEKGGGRVAGAACVIELTFLDGRKKLRGRDVFSIVKY